MKTSHLRVRWRSKRILMIILTVSVFLWFLFMTHAVNEVNNDYAESISDIGADESEVMSLIFDEVKGKDGHVIPKASGETDENDNALKKGKKEHLVNRKYIGVIDNIEQNQQETGLKIKIENNDKLILDEIAQDQKNPDAKDGNVIQFLETSKKISEVFRDGRDDSLNIAEVKEEDKIKRNPDLSFHIQKANQNIEKMEENKERINESHANEVHDDGRINLNEAGDINKDKQAVKEISNGNVDNEEAALLKANNHEKGGNYKQKSLLKEGDQEKRISVQDSNKETGGEIKASNHKQHGSDVDNLIFLRGDWPAQSFPNQPDFDLVKTIINVTDAGKDGHKFEFDTELLPLMEKKKILKAKLSHGMNEYASNWIGLNRTLKDYRLTGCSTRYSSSGLPQTSVIICFVNEAWSTLIRTVNSVLTNSPAHLVKEIILVDDGSSWEFLGKPLEVYMSRYPKVKILRTGTGIGLMGARMLGYRHTTTPTVTFLDSHCECSKGWLEPLLTPLATNPTIVMTPVVSVIDKMTFEMYPVTEVQVGIVSFPDLRFSWRCQPPREVVRRKDDILENVRSPAMAGGLFTITREFFDRIGGFDPGMKDWGGENIEMSLKIWMCGGRIETSPCSIVGHVFHSHNSYYKLRPKNYLTYHINVIRAAQVWMREESKKFYFGYNTYKDQMGDVSSRIQLRDRLGCKDFNWYIDDVNPEAALPGDGVYSGQIQNVGNSSLCVDMIKGIRNKSPEVCDCEKVASESSMYHRQMFDMTDLGEIVSMLKCLGHENSRPIIKDCNWVTESFIWSYEHKQIKNDNNMCLSVNATNQLVLDKCDASLSRQWNWHYNRPRRKYVLSLKEVRHLRH